MKKLSSYLSAGIAATATLQSSDAATIVTLYGPGAQSPSTSPATPVGISIGSSSGYRYLDTPGSQGGKSFFAFSQSANLLFTAGSDLKSSNYTRYALYGGTTAGFNNGAQSGSLNYANISFNGNDSVYEAVGQFYLDGAGGGYLVALAMNNDNSALSISAGKTAIDAVPEPSAIALLALGAGGMAMRRRRKAA